ncbi:OmpP1/FadL family transporter [Photobacterium sp. SDRW27]|uniref:outer membrane protein transport protein n=1 Tax=Photobacterium obscurum TaxID=2829490 RepID=UPI0022441DF2|nr:outer membrane protein transport protein [Photobacterium obscurum]MCW8329207.1 OmpP1/FadL family transporter [Photobacterium obscurum]
MKKFTVSLLAMACLSAFQAQSAGFQLNSQSVAGLGRAFSGDAIIADNAAVIAKNAAAMSLLDSPTISVGVIGIDSQVELTDTLYTSSSSTTQPLGDTELDNLTIVPNFHYVHPIENSRWTLGTTIHSNFGTDVEFEQNFDAPEFGGTTSLTSVNFGLSAAYEATDALSLGLGIDIIYGKGEISRPNLLDIDADGTTVGFNVGMAYIINEDNRFGLSYRYAPSLEASGTVNQLTGQATDLDVPLPDIIEFSGYHKLHNRFAVHYSLQYITWSEFDSLSSPSFDDPIKEYQWKDAGHLSVGMTYYAPENTELRAGYMYDLSPVDEINSLSIPDSDRHWFTVGATHYFTKDFSVDLALGYLVGEETKIDESMTIIGTSNIAALTNNSAWLGGLQVNYSF